MKRHMMILLVVFFALAQVGPAMAQDLVLSIPDALHGEVLAFGGATPGELQDKYTPLVIVEDPIINEEPPPAVKITLWGSIWTDRTGFERFLEGVVIALVWKDIQSSGGGNGNRH